MILWGNSQCALRARGGNFALVNAIPGTVLVDDGIGTLGGEEVR